MLEKSPHFSVIINVHNGEHYLRSAIESVFSQSFGDFELLIWDNNSNDQTNQIAQEAANSDSRVSVIKAKIKTSLYEARNQALKRTSGKFIAFLDSDDSWRQDKLSVASKRFGADNIDVFYSNFEFRNLNNHVSKIAYRAPLPEGFVQSKLASNYTVALSTIVFRRQVLNKLEGPFDTRFSIIGDFDAILRLAGFAKFGVSDLPLATIGVHSENLSYTAIETRVDEVNKWSVQEHSTESVKKGVFRRARASLLLDIALSQHKSKANRFFRISYLCVTSAVLIVLPSKLRWWLKNKEPIAR
jgi:glycosyltransferase involved in cell wall biosynthesis